MAVPIHVALTVAVVTGGGDRTGQEDLPRPHGSGVAARPRWRGNAIVSPPWPQGMSPEAGPKARAFPAIPPGAGDDSAVSKAKEVTDRTLPAGDKCSFREG